MKVKQFVFGKATTPEWFKGLCSTGKAKVVYDDEGEPLKAVVYAPTGSQEANIGDTILYVPSGLAVVPADKAKKYGLQKKDKVKNEVKEEIKPEEPETPETAQVADEADPVEEEKDGE